jgi:hypothetical protein
LEAITTKSSGEAPGKGALRRNLWMSAITLLAGSGTLICCVFPAVMVSLGAGAALAGIVSAAPQLVWLSEHKAAVFGFAGGMLLLSGAALWAGRRLPCPVEPGAALACIRLRKASNWLWIIAAVATAIGAFFAFVLPIITAES